MAEVSPRGDRRCRGAQVKKFLESAHVPLHLSYTLDAPEFSLNSER